MQTFIQILKISNFNSNTEVSKDAVFRAILDYKNQRVLLHHQNKISVSYYNGSNIKGSCISQYQQNRINQSRQT